MHVEQCTRSKGRDAGLTQQDWKRFFAKNPTPFVYMDALNDSDLFDQKNIMGFIKNVKFSDHGHFTYDLVPIRDDLTDGISIFQSIHQTIEPVYGTINRHGKEPIVEIFGIEYVNTDRPNAN